MHYACIAADLQASHPGLAPGSVEILPALVVGQGPGKNGLGFFDDLVGVKRSKPDIAQSIFVCHFFAIPCELGGTMANQIRFPDLKQDLAGLDIPNSIEAIKSSANRQSIPTDPYLRNARFVAVNV